VYYGDYIIDKALKMCRHKMPEGCKKVEEISIKQGEDEEIRVDVRHKILQEREMKGKYTR
jgi:hypothetical protein